MTALHRRLALLLAVVLAPLAHAVEVAPGVELIPGGFVPGSQPDGNTVVFRGEDGLVVLDTGRHPEHAKDVLAFVEKSRLPVKAIVNSHWHLDHVGGNALLKKAYPGARVYATSAIEDARRGFLAGYRAQLVEMIDRTPDAEKQKPWRAEIALIDSGSALSPDEVLVSSGERTLAGRKLELALVTRAVTAGDVYVFDPKTRVLAAGDLVSLPVPFLDTACPERWKAALLELGKRDFSVLVPGHGAPMDRKGFETYRAAFDGLLACSSSKATNEACREGWMKSAAPLLASEDPKFVRSVVDYYVGGVLRGDPAPLAERCGAAPR